MLFKKFSPISTTFRSINSTAVGFIFAFKIRGTDSIPALRLSYEIKRLAELSGLPTSFKRHFVKTASVP